MAHFNRSLVVSLAAFSLIASACSRSGGSGGGPAAANPPPRPQQQANGSPTPSSQSELDTQSSKSSQANQTAPGQPSGTIPERTSGGRQTAPQNASQNSNGPQSSNEKDPTQTSAANSNGPSVVIYDPTGLTPSQIFASSQAQGPAVVGSPSTIANGQSAESLYFSGSGQDDLRASLQGAVDSKTKPERVQRDKDFAATVRNGSFDIDWTTRAATINVTMNRAGGPTTFAFSAVLDNKLLFHAGDLRHGDRVSVEAACMDLNGGCQTVYAKVQDGTGGLIRTAHMIIRQTPATLHTHADGFGVAQNGEFDALLRTLVRTDKHAGELNALDKLTLRTSETINGQSSFIVEMGIRSSLNAEETLNFGGPLVKPASDINLDASAQVLASSSPAGDTVRAVSLTQNDGRGTITLAVTIRKATADAQEDTMDLTIARIHKPVRQIIVK